MAASQCCQVRLPSHNTVSSIISLPLHLVTIQYPQAYTVRISRFPASLQLFSTTWTGQIHNIHWAPQPCTTLTTAMRLLHAKKLTFYEFQGSNIPPYAILSHRWEDGEVTLQDMESVSRNWNKKQGLRKIKECCRQATMDGLMYVWVDTCCIDKLSSAELSEAINSMYRWYQNSTICYAYLSDVSVPKDEGNILSSALGSMTQFQRSKWWTRGWTLQELIAPSIVKFFANDQRDGWCLIGDKSTLLDSIVHRTSIVREVFQGLDVRRCSIATRMSWASERETTRIEDLAYCLLGILGVNMPLLYGEGERAFLRLQVSYSYSSRAGRISLIVARKRS
jgi:hypothetical protein